jgi:hypothetical protein
LLKNPASSCTCMITVSITFSPLCSPIIEFVHS